MDSLRLQPVVFCGENPHVVLVNEAGKITAAASFWDCTYSAYGEGRVLLVYLDAANATGLHHPSVLVYSDNAPLARYLTDTFNQHFEDWDDLGFGGAPIQPARFVKESDSRQFYRVACYSEQTRIEVTWSDMRGTSFRTFPDIRDGGFGPEGDEHYHVSNVLFLCAQGQILINAQAAAGAPDTRTLPDGRFSTSVFLALSETWIKIEMDEE